MLAFLLSLFSKPYALVEREVDRHTMFKGTDEGA